LRLFTGPGGHRPGDPPLRLRFGQLLGVEEPWVRWFPARHIAFTSRDPEVEEEVRRVPDAPGLESAGFQDVRVETRQASVRPVESPDVVPGVRKGEPDRI